MISRYHSTLATRGKPGWSRPGASLPLRSGPALGRYSATAGGKRQSADRTALDVPKMGVNMPRLGNAWRGDIRRDDPKDGRRNATADGLGGRPALVSCAFAHRPRSGTLAWRKPARGSARIVGATLVVARPGVVQAAGTGRDKPVPYDARAGTVHEFDMGRNLFPARPRTEAPGWKLPWEVGVAGPEAAQRQRSAGPAWGRSHRTRHMPWRWRLCVCAGTGRRRGIWSSSACSTLWIFRRSRGVCW